MCVKNASSRGFLQPRVYKIESHRSLGSVHAEVMRGPDLKPSLMLGVTQLVETCLHNIQPTVSYDAFCFLNAIISFYHNLTCFISCICEAFFYTSTMILVVVNESLAISLMKRLKQFWTPTGFEPVISQRSDQLSYEATHDGRWSFPGTNNAWSWINGRNDIYEITHILNCRHEIKWSYDPCSYNIL